MTRTCRIKKCCLLLCPDKAEMCHCSKSATKPAWDHFDDLIHLPCDSIDDLIHLPSDCMYAEDQQHASCNFHDYKYHNHSTSVIYTLLVSLACTIFFSCVGHRITCNARRQLTSMCRQGARDSCCTLSGASLIVVNCTNAVLRSLLRIACITAVLCSQLRDAAQLASGKAWAAVVNWTGPISLVSQGDP